MGVPFIPLQLFSYLMIHGFVLLMKSHLGSYPCPLNLNYFWNLGFLLLVTILLQMMTGILLSLHYTSDIHSAYYSVMHIIREVYYGWCLRFLHSSGASFVFLVLFIHVARAISYGSNFYNPNTWFSGIVLFLFLMAIAFMGYVLPWGQMSFWGATVITNLLSPFPCLIEWVCGGHYVYNPTLKRFFYLHFLSSNNPLGLNTNNKIPFFPFIFIKDLFGLFLIFLFIILQTHFGIYTLSHPDNALEVSGLVTPLHIVPEWYFLCQYAMLKAVPNKNAGFIILLTSILIFFLFGEIRNLTTFTRLVHSNSGSSFFYFIFLFFCNLFSMDRCSITSGEVYILWSYLDIRLLLFYYYVCISFKK